MAEIGIIKNNVWSYHDRPQRAVAVAAFLLIFASFLAVIILRQSSYAEFLALSLVILLVLSFTERSTSVEIDREEATVRKVQQLLFFKRTKTYPLHNFDTVSLHNKEAAVEEGYKIILYSVILEGKALSVELLSTDDEKEGKVLRKELSEFLHLSKEST